MFCEARLSVGCALVKELQGNAAPPFVAQMPIYLLTFAQDRERKSRRHQQAATV